MTRKILRRKFLRKAGLGVAGLAATLPSSQAYAANETIRVACIGTGGRSCGRLMPALKKVPGARIVAVCDVWDQHLERARKLAGGDVLTTKYYPELLANKDVDAVMIATPDHWHVPITVDACEAGKDVYVEKPLTHEVAEGKRVIEAQNKHKRVVQVGTQQRSMPQYLKACEIVKSGALGKIIKAHTTWNRNSTIGGRHKYGIDPKSVDWKQFLGPARKQPFDEFRFRNWRWFWDFGGGLFTDLMVHQIDIVHWACGTGEPSVATSIGDHFQAKGVWETPETVQTLMQYPDHGLQAYFEGSFTNARHGAMVEIMGSDATLYIDRSRYELHPERGRRKYEEMVLDRDRRGADFSRVDGEVLHLTNWIECVRSRKKPVAPAEAGVSAANAAHLANQALRAGKVARRT